MYEDGPQWLYRIYDSPKGKLLLYVGVTNSLGRRVGQHVRGKEWFPEDGRITFEMYDDRASVEEAERKAIRRERPVHNVQHNVRVELTVRADFEMTGTALFGATAVVLGVILLAKWGSDAYSVRRARVLAERQGLEHESPKVANPFTEQPLSTPAQLFWTMAVLACSPPPPRLVPGDPESAKAFLAWHEKMTSGAAMWWPQPAAASAPSQPAAVPDHAPEHG